MAKKFEKGFALFMVVWSLIITLFFIGIPEWPSPTPLLGEVVDQMGFKWGLAFYNILLSLILIISLFLRSLFKQFRSPDGARKRDYLGGLLISVGLIAMFVSEIWFSESVIAQLIACSISICFSLAAWRGFSRLERSGTLAPNNKPNEEAHV